MRTGVPFNENRFFPVRISTQGKPCSGPVLALYGIAVWAVLGEQHALHSTLGFCHIPARKEMNVPIQKRS